MNDRETRDWSREHWIKQHIHEPLYELVWPLLRRAMRDYLRKRAEADGTLIVNQDDPVGALLQVLGTHPSELDLAREAVVALIKDGILECDGRSIWMPERPASQARPVVVGETERTVPSTAPGGKRTSTQRVREHRERKRNERNALEGVSRPVSAVTEAVSLTVPPGVSPSRGDLFQDPLLSPKDQKDQEDTHLPPDETRTRRGVTPRVSQGVSEEPGDEENEDEALKGNGAKREPIRQNQGAASPPSSIEDALGIELATRAALVMDKPELGDKLRPDRWPEVQSLAAAFAKARNCPTQLLGRYSLDRAVQLAVALYAAGYSQAELTHVVTVIANQEWAKGKGLGSLLTFKVVDANRLKPLVKTGEGLSPRAAAALARAREGLRTREAG